MLNNDQRKECKRLVQEKAFFQYLENHVATASMVSEETKIPQKCLTRYKRKYEKAGRLWEVKRTYCALTGFMAWYLTTNPEKAPKQGQLSLFES